MEPENAARDAEDRGRERPYSGPFLVVGLGNPGIEYQWTPHNAGFLAVDRLAERAGAVVSNRRCRALTATTRIAGREVVLAKPETFMNLSGLSVQALVEEFDAGQPNFAKRRAAEQAEQIEQVWAKLRPLMSWLSEDGD